MKQCWREGKWDCEYVREGKRVGVYDEWTCSCADSIRLLSGPVGFFYIKMRARRLVLYLHFWLYFRSIHLTHTRTHTPSVSSCFPLYFSPFLTSLVSACLSLFSPRSSVRIWASSPPRLTYILSSCSLLSCSSLPSPSFSSSLPLSSLLAEPTSWAPSPPPKKINPDTHTPRYYTRCTRIQNQAQTHLQPAAQHLILMLGEEGALQPFLLFIFLVVLLLYFFCPTIHFLISFPLQSFSPSFNACPESRCEMLGF